MDEKEEHRKGLNLHGIRRRVLRFAPKKIPSTLWATIAREDYSTFSIAARSSWNATSSSRGTRGILSGASQKPIKKFNLEA
jgi:hypothetical protein